MENLSLEEVKIYFGYITSIIHYHQKDIKDGEWGSYEEMLKLYPKSRLGFSLKVRQNAYKGLEWAMQNPDTDFKSIEPWFVKDNAEYFLQMKELYDFMTKYKMYE